MTDKPGSYDYATQMRQRMIGRTLLTEDAEAAAADIAVPMPEHASVVSTYAKECIAAALPTAIAAELDRLVDETDWAWAVGGSLKRRAAELRGEV